MSFFRQFPTTVYDIRKNGALTRITDLFRSVTSPQVKLDPTISYTDYRIRNGERPDVASQLLYGDPDYYWTFFIVNDALKSGHATWPMSDSAMETYLTQEYDAYSVIQLGDTDAHYLIGGLDSQTPINSIPSSLTWGGAYAGTTSSADVAYPYRLYALSDILVSGNTYVLTVNGLQEPSSIARPFVVPGYIDPFEGGVVLMGEFIQFQQGSPTQFTAQFESIVIATLEDMSSSSSISTNITIDDRQILPERATTVAGVDFKASDDVYVYDPITGESRRVMKYDPYMQQIWVYRESSSDDFVTRVIRNGAGGSFQLSSSASGTPLLTLAIDNVVYSTFAALGYDDGQRIASPGILPTIVNGRDAIHHFVFTPQVGDVVNFQTQNGQGISGTVAELMDTHANGYGGIVMTTGARYYFTDPQGFLLTAQDVMSNVTTTVTSTISPLNRVYPVTYAEHEAQLNESRSSIRVVNPDYIRSFVKQYRDLINT